MELYWLGDCYRFIGYDEGCGGILICSRGYFYLGIGYGRNMGNSGLGGVNWSGMFL